MPDDLLTPRAKELALTIREAAELCNKVWALLPQSAQAALRLGGDGKIEAFRINRWRYDDGTFGPRNTTTLEIAGCEKIDLSEALADVEIDHLRVVAKWWELDFKCYPLMGIRELQARYEGREFVRHISVPQWEPPDE